MIYITMGHPRSISLEILFKSLPNFKNLPIVLVAVKKELENFLRDYNYKYTLTDNKLITSEFNISLILVRENKYPSSTLVLKKVLSIIKGDDILITMPTSKDQLILNGKVAAGHTEFFREYYKDFNIPMIFLGSKGPLLLISDHIALSKVSKISYQLICQKVAITVKNFDKYFYPIKKVIIAGINPHAGENGIIGDDSNVSRAVAKLKKNLKIEVLGPLAGDSLFFHDSKHTLLVYMYHDQGLGPFKAVNKFKGINISLGMPFLRMSVDHGTAFDLYGKNIADTKGIIFVLEWAKKIYEKLSNK